MCWLVALAIVVGLVVLGVVLSGRDRKQAPARLAEAKAALARDDPNEALRLLEKAFWVPVSDKFAAEDARRCLEVVELTEQIALKKGTNIQDVSERLKGALQTAAQASGGEVPAKLSDPFKKFLARAAREPKDVAGALSGATTPFLSADLEDKGPRSIGEPTDEQMSLVAKIGRKAFFGSPDEALQMVAEHLPTATGAFKVELLSVRGSCYALKKDQAAAVVDYQACCELEPDRALHCTNLCETLVKLGRRDEAKAAAAKAVQVARTKKERADAEKLLRSIA